jgi:protein-histidine pros-kinase
MVIAGNECAFSLLVAIMTLPHDPAPSFGDLPPLLFLELVEQAPLAISITDRNARILYVNPAFTRVTGYAAQQLIGRNSSLLSYKTTPREIYEDLWAHIAQGKPWHGRLVNRKADGNRYLADLTITPIHDENGEITHFLGTQNDVTELHILHERLQNQKRLIESIIDLAPVAVVLLDEEERVVLDNQEYKKLMGCFGQLEPAAAVLQALRAEVGDAGWHNLMDEGEFAQRMLRFDRSGQDGPRWYASSGKWFEQKDSSVDRFFTEAGHRYLLLLIADNTAFKRQQQTEWLQALRTMLSEGELISRLRETLSGAAFQLAGPLNVIAAAERQLVRRLPPCDAALAALREAREQGEASLELLKSAMPSVPPEAWQPVNCNELLHDVLQLSTGRFLAEGVVVEWKPALRLGVVEAQPVALRGAFAQLINNAIDALHENRSRRRELRLASYEHDGWVEIEISDSGPGIPEALRLKVFEPFFSTRAGGARAGMGLTLAQETILHHQGELEIDPNQQAGCRVVVRLPLLGKENHGS